jgi:DNA uptake protein ComE-like DNA-binding protein
MAQVRQPAAGCYRASYPTVAWHSVKCVAAPNIPLVPRPVSQSARHAGPELVGDGHDYSAVVTGKISKATGTFKDVSSGISEQGLPDGAGTKMVPNSFSLQLNTQFFTGSPACDGSSAPSKCLAWQQFVYAYQNASKGYIFMQYWLINYKAKCPKGWFTYSSDCYTNSNAVNIPTVTAKELGTLSLSGSAAAGKLDAISLALGSGKATSVTNSDSKIDLAAHWNTAEWNVFGDGGGSKANFGKNSTLQAQTALTETSKAAPKCVLEGFTAETNSLTLTTTPKLGTQSSPTIATRATNGTIGKANCAAAS